MQRFFRFATLGILAVAAMTACAVDTITITPVTPTAGVRFINALPDSAGAFGLDFHFIDIVENSTAFRIPFRNAPTGAVTAAAATAIQYRAAQAGSRHFAIFLDDSIQAITSKKLKDSTVTLVEGKNYTFILWGEARAGQMKLTVIDETIADPGANKVALRVINAGGTAIDVRTFKANATLPTAATWANVGPLSASTFVTSDTGSIRYNVQPAGGGTVLFADMTALPGAPASSTAGPAGKIDTDPVPGTLVPGSAVTLVVFPRSTAGARTPQTAAFAIPAGAFIWDRRPARGY